MNQEQILSVVRTLLTVLGTLLVSRGIIRPEDLNTTVGLVVTAIGAIMPVVSLIWGIWNKTKANTIAAAANLDNVSSIVTDAAMASKIPNAKVVSPTGASQ